MSRKKTIKFDPLYWNNGRNRLSTCYGKYSKEPYNWTIYELFKKFKQVCPYLVYLNTSPLGDFMKQSVLEYCLFMTRREKWLHENCKGYWYDTGEDMLDRRKTKNIRKVFMFQHKEDALKFKLIWS